jgi:hypothetical protein
LEHNQCIALPFVTFKILHDGARLAVVRDDNRLPGIVNFVNDLIGMSHQVAD